MKQQLSNYIHSNPNTWGRYLNKHPELYDYVNSVEKGNSVAEKAYIAVHGSVDHNCKSCGKPTLFENFMKGYRPYCSSQCNQDDKVKEANNALLSRINALTNFELMSNISKGGKFGRKTFTVQNKTCGHIFEVNNLSLFTNPSNYCPSCGAKDRQVKMTRHNVDRKKDQREKIMKSQSLAFSQYSRIVRALTNKVYKQFKHLINPQNLKISKKDYHVDHIVTIFDGWQHNIDYRLISAASNLQILPAKANLQKSTRSTEHKLEELRAVMQYIPDIKNNLVIDEAQISTAIISCNEGKIGVAIPQHSQQAADEQAKNKDLFLRYIFWGELKESVTLQRIHYWFKNDISSNTKIHARSCEIELLTAAECRKFLDKNHSQGFLAAKVYLGLKHKGKLVSVMTFGKPRFAKKYQWELLRFASSANVRGAASKLFSYFIKTFKPQNLISYSNNSYGSGNVYSMLGLVFSHNTPPSRWYYHPADPENVIKMSSFKFAKSDEKLLLEKKYISFENKGNSVYVWASPNA